MNRWLIAARPRPTRATTEIHASKSCHAMGGFSRPTTPRTCAARTLPAGKFRAWRLTAASGMMHLRSSSPGGDFLQNLRPRTARPIGQPGAKPILPIYFVTRNEILKIPRGVRRLPIGVRPAARWRVGEADAAGPVEHQDRHHVAEVAVVERLVVGERR